MGFVSVLKKVGMVLREAGAIGADVAGLPFVAQILQVNPKAAAAVPTVLGDLNSLVAILGTVETIGQIQGSTGADKLKLAGPLIGQALDLWAKANLPGHELQDPEKAAKAADGIASNLADFLNAWG